MKSGKGYGWGAQQAHAQGGQSADAGIDSAASAQISEDAIAELLYMIEEEKLAGDVYTAFYDLYGAQVFDNIADSEDRHFDALVSQAENLGLDVDSIVFNDAGTFEDPELQELYDSLLAQGSTSLESAIGVGVAIETRDMTDIAEAAASVEGTQLEQVYQNLLTGSSYHLDAFESLL